LIAGEDQMSVHVLAAPAVVVLGRDPGCDVLLVHGKISRHHARVIVDDEISLEDLGSTNGVWLRGERLEAGARAPFRVGDSARLGRYTIVLLEGTVSATPSSDAAPRASAEVRDPTPAGKTELLERVARYGGNVLIEGETGVGKDVLAATLHQLSDRPGAVVAINCAALSTPLLESELFGHERGAFTGATHTKIGLLEIAGEGTALLDEIGDLAIEVQAKLLRALESRQFYRVGGVEPITLRARLIAATHKRLTEEVANGTFRQDLYFRLNGITLEIPPLRARRASIAALATELLGEAAPRLSPAALAVLLAYDWPGNVRELRHVLDRATLLSGEGTIGADHILLAPARASSGGRDEDRREFVAIAIAQHGNSAAIARALGTSRTQVRRLADRFELDLAALRKRT
jgi:transcriptional regulator with PAS, ATPase and Fis domain